mmetsp:Transcript_41355/g.108679  ORF Transcript_41355/g.108679 Transcript_41355/m.108679 type:complete len:323 (-) Transcript_41355:869-1837(-)
MAPTSFTNSMMLPCSTSVAVVKLRISQNPKIASTYSPGNIGSIPDPAPCKFLEMIRVPASPNPKSNRVPSLINVFSRITVSMGSSCFSSVHSQEMARYTCVSLAGGLLSFSFLALFACCSLRYSWKPSWVAFRGSSFICCKIVTMRSMGDSTSRLASWVNMVFAVDSTMQRKIVCSMLRIAATSLMGRRSNAKMNRGTVGSSWNMSGITTSNSLDRRSSLGQLLSTTECPSHPVEQSKNVQVLSARRGELSLSSTKGAMLPVTYRDDGLLKISSHTVTSVSFCTSTAPTASSCLVKNPSHIKEDRYLPLFPTRSSSPVAWGF